MQALALRLIGTPLEMRDYMPLLKWLILTGVTLFGLAAVWHFGLLQIMLQNDRSYITFVIIGLYVFFSLHCLGLTVGLSQETNAAHRVQEQIAKAGDSFQVVGERVILGDGTSLLDCKVTDHIRNLIIKARLQGGARVDQSLLLRRLADSLRERQSTGWFVADAMLKLGLLGTVIGFILMLAPISTLDTFDVESLKGALSSMSGGMAVALFTTLAGLIGGTLLKLQYYILDEGTGYLFGLATEMTEVYVVSVLDREAHGRV